MLLVPLSQAASPEGIIALAVVYFIFALFSKAKKAAQKNAPSRLPQEPMRSGTEPAPSAPASSGFSLEAVVREIERVKQEAERRTAPATDAGRPRHTTSVSRPKSEGSRPRQLPSTERKGRMARAMDEKGPLGRHSKTRLPASEEFEDRTSLEEGGSIEVPGRLENLDESRRRRVEVDQDEGAEALVQRRIQQAESRNRSFSESDHRAFHDKIKQPDAANPAPSLRLTAGQLKTAFVWREILGPPKSLE